jgi:hypothetical protein
MNSLFMGNFRAAFSWKGIEFQDFREYSYWDDAKYIDWSVSSREQSTIIRRYREEKQGDILCIVDVRESLEYENKVKIWVYDATLELLYYASGQSWENFGWYIIDSLSERYISPKKSIIWMHKLEKFKQNYRKNSEVLSLNFIMKNPIKRSVLFVMSDSMIIDEKSFKLAAMRHDIVFVHVSSHFENTLDGEWISRLTGMKQGYNINLGDQEKKANYIKKRQEKLHMFSRQLKKVWVDSVFLNEQSSIFAEFLKLMKGREKI